MPQAPQYQAPQALRYLRGPADQVQPPVQQPVKQVNYYAPYTVPDWGGYQAMLAEQERNIIVSFRSSCNQIGWTILSGLLLLTLISILTTVVLVPSSLPWRNEGLAHGWKQPAFFLSESILHPWLSQFLPYAAFTERVPMSNAFPSKQVSFPVAATTVMSNFGVCILANFPATWMMVFQRFGISQGRCQAMGSIKTFWPRYSFFIGVAVIPSLVEEFLFRGLLCLLRREWMALPSFSPLSSLPCFTAIYPGGLCVYLWVGSRPYNLFAPGISDCDYYSFHNNGWSVINQILYSSGLGSGRLGLLYLHLCHTGLENHRHDFSWR